MEKTYIDYFKDEIRELKDSGKDFDRTVLYFPDIITMLCSLLDEEGIDKESRLLIHVALGYLMVPNDVLPEDVYGAYGYMDDLYLSCVVANNIKRKHHDVMLRYWINDDDMDKTLDLCTFASEKFLNAKGLKEKLMVFCGLKDP